MIPILSFLAALRLITEAQTCNNGQGKFVFEKMSGYIGNYSRSTSKEYLSLVDAPVKVLEECFLKCRKLSNSDQLCVAFDLLPGERRSSPYQNTLSNENNFQKLTAHYEQSNCILHIGSISNFDQPNRSLNDKKSNTINSETNYDLTLENLFKTTNILRKQQNSWHFSAQCIKNKLVSDCNRTYAFDRTTNRKLTKVNFEFSNSNRTDCEEKCLEKTDLPCRSISFDTITMKCGLSKETRQSRPDLYKTDVNFEYIENLCLKRNQLCTYNVFIAQKNKELKGIFERELSIANDLYECAITCINSINEKGFFCRSFSYDQTGHTCILYDEPSDLDLVEDFENITKISQAHLFTVMCMFDKEDEIWNNSIIELHPKKRLSGPHEVEIVAKSIINCIHECGKRFAYNCKTFEFSLKEQLCRFSSEFGHQRRAITGFPHLTYDSSFDFYNIIAVQNPNEVLYQGSINNLLNHNSMYNHANSQNELSDLLPQNNYFHTAVNMMKNQQTQPRTNMQHFNQFIQTNNNLPGYGNERNQIIIGSNSINPTSNNLHYSNNYMNNLVPDFTSSSNQQKNYLNQVSPLITVFQQQQRQASSPENQNGPGIIYPTNYNDQHQQQQKSTSIQLTNKSQQSSSQLINSSNNPQIGSSKDTSSSNLLTVSTNTHFNQIYPNFIQSAANSPPPAYGIPYHSPISSSILSLNSPVNSVQSNSINISPSVSNIQASNTGFNVDRCKYPISLSNVVSNSLSLDSLSSNPTASLLNYKFTKVGFGSRLKSNYIFKVIQANKIEACEKACIESRDFTCKSFNYRSYFPAENCELSQYDTKQLKLDSPQFFELNTQYNFYERDLNQLFNSNNLNSVNLLAMSTNENPNFAAECMEVSQSCTQDGMEFTLRTSDKFYGRIYTYGFYESCYFDGNGGNVNVLKISRANSFPRCGTQQYGDAMTNIVVVQFNDYVQTSRDKKYNLTCYFSGPGEAVITSNYLDTKTDPRHPMQIESLPPQNILTSNVILRILYRGNPTNVIGVGDLLTFRLEAKSQYRYDFYNSDIFATNVIAKDPYTGRQVQLIDAKGCPADLYVFPELHKTPDGALEAEFYAFKLPDSNFLVFQATVRACRGPCEPIICSDSGRGQGTFPSWGRRRKRNIEDQFENDIISSTKSKDKLEDKILTLEEEKEEVHELLRVYSSRADIPKAEALKEELELNEEKVLSDQKKVKNLVENTKYKIQKINEICVSQVHYYALLVSIILLVSWFSVGIVYFAINLGNKQGKLNSLKKLVDSSTNLNPTLIEKKKNSNTDVVYANICMTERSKPISESGMVSMNMY